MIVRYDVTSIFQRRIYANILLTEYWQKYYIIRTVSFIQKKDISVLFLPQNVRLYLSQWIKTKKLLKKIAETPEDASEALNKITFKEVVHELVEAWQCVKINLMQKIRMLTFKKCLN